MANQVDSKTNIESMTKAELQAEARARGLSPDGTRSDLLSRLQSEKGSPGGEAAEQGDGERQDRREPPAGEAAEQGDAERQDRREPTREPDTSHREAEASHREPERSHNEAIEPSDAPVRLDEVTPAATKHLAELTERHVEGVVGARPTPSGYRLLIDVLELSRVPTSTDVLATYAVEVDRSGQITSYSRAQRYYRNERWGE